MKTKEINLWELRKKCNELSPKEIILHSDNTTFNFSEIGFRFDLRFNKIDFCLNPDIIYLMFGNSCLQISKIKSIRQREKFNRYRVEITCEDTFGTYKETTYTLLFM